MSIKGKKIKLVFAGGGALRALWSIHSFARRSHVATGAEVVILDLDGQRAQLVAKLAQLMPEAEDSALSVRGTTDIADAVDGADFVYVTMRPGSKSVQEKDARIAIRHGFGGFETLEDFGPTSVFCALRGIASLTPILRQMEARCPAAWLIVLSNPMSILTDAALRYSKIRTMGICASIWGSVERLRRVIGDDLNDHEFTAAGLNHFGWVLTAKQNGEDVYGELLGRVRSIAREKLGKWDRLFVEVSDLFGFFPQPGDHGLCWFFLKELGVEAEQMLGSLNDPAQKDQEKRIKDAVVRGAGKEIWDDPLLRRWRTPGKHHGFYDGGIEFIEAVLTDSGRVLDINTRNGTAVAEMPENAVLEFSCPVTARGPEPQPVGKLPASITPLTTAIVAHQQRVVDAAVAQDRRILREAILMDPSQRSLGTAMAWMEAMFDNNRDYLSSNWY